MRQTDLICTTPSAQKRIPATTESRNRWNGETKSKRTHHVLKLMNGTNSFPGISMEIRNMNSEVRRIGGMNIVDESPQWKGSPVRPVDLGLPKYRFEAIERHFYENMNPKSQEIYCSAA